MSPKLTIRTTILLLIAACAVCAIASVIYLMYASRYVYTDKAEISAPLIQLGPAAPGVLMSVRIDDGDHVAAFQPVARVGDEILISQVDGVALSVKKDIGAAYAPGQSVVTMIDPRELKVVARVQEDKGLKDIKVGQQAIFTVDAFGGRQFFGTVSGISLTNREGDVVFNISDKRAEKEFAIKITYDTAVYPQLQNGMSARVWIVK